MNIIGFEKTKACPSFSYDHFRIIRRLHFDYEAERPGNGPIVELLVESEDLRPNYALLLRFTGVRGLRLENFGGCETSVVFDVVSLKDRQWEDIYWEVFDYEEAMLRFYCKTVEVVSLTALQ